MRSEPQRPDPQHAEYRTPVDAGTPRHTLAVIALATVLAALLATAATLLVHRQVLAPRFAPRLATVDVVRLVDEHQAGMLRELEALSAEEISRRRPQATQRTQAFARELDAALARLGEQCRCVIVNRAAVLGGAGLADHTDLLRTELRTAPRTDVRPPAASGAPASPLVPSASIR